MKPLPDFIASHYTFLFSAAIVLAFLGSSLIKRHRVKIESLATIAACSVTLISSVEMALVLFHGEPRELCNLLNASGAQLTFSMGLMVVFLVSTNEILKNFRKIYS